MCINNKRVAKAHSTFISFRYNILKKSNNDCLKLDATVHNIILRGWTSLGRLDKVKEIFRYMKMAKVQPNMHSHALHLACVARQKSYDVNYVRSIFKKMEADNLAINRIFIDSQLLHDEEKLVKNLIKPLLPNVSFVQATINDTYECVLLENLNQKDKHMQPLGLPLSELKSRSAEQRQMERKSFTSIKSIYIDRTMPAHQVNHYIKMWTKFENEWRSVLRSVLKDKLNEESMKFFRHDSLFTIYPFLTSIDSNTLVEMMLDEMKSLVTSISEYYSPPFQTLCASLGRRVQNVYLSKVKQKHPSSQAILRLYDSYLDYLTRDRRVNSRIFMEKRAKDLSLNFHSDINEMRWSYNVCQRIGRFLYEIMMDNLTIDQKILFPKLPEKKRKIISKVYCLLSPTKSEARIQADHIFFNLCKTLRARELIFDCNELPMISPPLPWISSKVGAYLIMDTELIREIRNSSVLNIPESSPPPVLDALNSLQMQPWIVNQPILDLAIEIFNLNGDESLDIPLHQSNMPKAKKIPNNLSPHEKSRLVKENIQLDKERSEMYSLWCDCLYKLSIANHLRDKVIWMPHNLDFRGRVYSIPPHLQHLGADISRGLLLFAIGKPLGPHGLDWLKIHAINLTGKLKHSTNIERLQYANEHLDEMIASARNAKSPEGSWWRESDEPWQTLACCIEISRAIDSGDPETYVCHFPVHQDGSCNGLQHYAALGRDEVGARSVNLHNCERPQDVYNEVAKLVEIERKKDAENGDKLAASLEGIISRKIVKQPVMTFVYGVTPFGARRQIRKRLSELPDFTKEREIQAAAYLVTKVFLSLQKMFTATREIQLWFNSCAEVISRQLDQPVKWTTPLGFHVVQPYVKMYDTSDIKRIISHNWKINSMKQKNGFAPNFIHSLDSVHMMLTALNCEAERINFVSVHDCFWTHASDIQQLNKICRRVFVDLHSLPILSNLSDSFIKSYAQELSTLASKSPDDFNSVMSTLIEVPATGNFDLQQVLHSTYFFS